MALQSRSDLLVAPDGYHLKAADDSGDILFILPEAVAISKLDFDVHGGTLLQTHLRNLLPQIWDACHRAYRDALASGAAFPLRIVLTQKDFDPHV